MQASELRVPARDGTALFVRAFLPDDTTSNPPRALVVISHGMAEHSARYARLAEGLTSAGYAVYANDHRGHGHTPTNPADLGHFADRNGFAMVVSDLQQVIDAAKGKHP